VYGEAAGRPFWSFYAYSVFSAYLLLTVPAAVRGVIALEFGEFENDRRGPKGGSNSRCLWQLLSAIPNFAIIRRHFGFGP
jgi:hypothetical protein